MKRAYPIGLLFLVFLCHLPFLTADPDTKVDLGTRGAWTDEGLYSSQVRNLVNDGHFGFKESSNAVRGPLYNLIQYPFFRIFGTHRLVARLIVLLFTCGVLLLFAFLPGYEKLTTFLVLLNLFQFHIFQFSHYGLSEMMCISFILLSLYFLIRYHRADLPGNKILHLIWASFFIFCAYACKIQFLYVACLPPLALIYQSMPVSFKKEKRQNLIYTGWAVLFAGLFSMVYLVWFLANRDLYTFVMQYETAGRYSNQISSLMETFRFNFSLFLWTKELVPLLLLFMTGIVVMTLSRKKREINPEYALIFGFAFFWVLVELHKIPMTYLPYRYMLSLIFALGLALAIMLDAAGWISAPWQKACMITAIGLLLFNMSFNYAGYRRKTYDLNKIEGYLGHYDLRGLYALGSWATASCWDSKAHTIPIWNEYFNWKDPIRQFKTRLVITEKDESETDKAFSSQGIDLKSICDSSREFKVWRYEVVVYWISGNPPHQPQKIPPQ